VRALRRDGLDPAAGDPHLSHVALYHVDQAVLRYAEQIPHHIRSLDAIHLATLMAVSPAAVLASHDGAMLAVAAKLGIQTIDPVQPTGKPPPRAPERASPGQEGETAGGGWIQ
jgi:hypothetical protein